MGLKQTNERGHNAAARPALRPRAHPFLLLLTAVHGALVGLRGLGFLVLVPPPPRPPKKATASAAPRDGKIRAKKAFAPPRPLCA
jgi:hypothetical protein